ncbi:MAG: alpha-amylase family glycosyl hydrolase [Chitinophagales bacterium]|nr:alpha-amylase family glycosyl hydrolase [Chitinophagales bacterium]
MKYATLLVAMLYVGIVSSQSFMMQAWYWDFPKNGCNNYNGSSWAATLNAQASDMSGFSHLWLPPFTRASFGSCSNGYDPKDLYDLGEYGGGATGFGTRSEVDNLITTMGIHNILPVADVVYNHRDGGSAEPNPAVKDYIEQHMASGKSPFPSDRYHCYLPIGGSTGLGAGDYYFQISSKTGDYGSSHRYKVYMSTNGSSAAYQGTVDEVEPNGGSICSQISNSIQLKEDMRAYLGDDGNGCTTDEFVLTLNNGDFNSSDQITIYLNNIAGGYSDHRIYGIYYDDGNGKVAVDLNNLVYRTYTDFTNMPSGQGESDYNHFKPNDNNASTTYLGGDWDFMYFFYDYDQFQPQVGTLFSDWTKWLWEDVGIRGYRMDAVKHFTPSFIGTAFSGIQASGYQPTVAVGEFFDSNPYTLKSWVDDANAGSGSTTVQVFDFALRSALKSACEDENGYDVRNVFQSGVVDGAGSTGFRTVTFLNNHDFRSNGEYCKGDLLLGYAYLLTNNQVGLPCVFYPDYFGVDLGYYHPTALKSSIDQLMALHSTYIVGAPQVDYLNRFSTPYSANYFNGCQDRALIYQISGGPSGQEVIVAINFCNGTLSVDHVINTFNAPSGTVFNDILGNSAYPFAVVSDQNHSLPNSIYMELPPNSFSVWVQQQASLPVELAGFSVRKGDQVALLNWQSAQEVDFKGYELQRSTDGIHFDYLAWIPGKGEEGHQLYDYTDRSIINGNTYYYRLKLIDIDGSFEFSEIQSISFNATETLPIEVFPNPALETIKMRWSSQFENDGQLTIYNQIGKAIHKKSISLQQGRNVQNLTISDWPTGVYYIDIQSQSGFKWRQSFVKK